MFPNEDLLRGIPLAAASSTITARGTLIMLSDAPTSHFFTLIFPVTIFLLKPTESVSGEKET